MRNISIGGKDFKVVASPMTLFFYKKEFKRDLLGDYMAFSKMDKDIEEFDGINILQMAWAMIKTYKIGQLESFEQWLGSLEYVDFDDEDLMMSVIEEATQGFFRSGEKTHKEITG